MAAYPSTLPGPLRDGYQIAPASQVVSTDMEVGAPRMRRRSSAVNETISVSYKYTDAQMATFRAWFDSATGANAGASWFTVTLGRGTSGLVACEARFSTGTFTASVLPGLNWLVSTTLELR